jgi:hypothetical protein
LEFRPLGAALNLHGRLGCDSSNDVTRRNYVLTRIDINGEARPAFTGEVDSEGALQNIVRDHSAPQVSDGFIYDSASQ